MPPFPAASSCSASARIGQGVLPLILRHLDVPRDRITIVTAETRGGGGGGRYGVRFIRQPLTRDNYRDVLEPLLGPGDFLLNVSVDVSSRRADRAVPGEQGALYLDTCIEPWAGGYTDRRLTPSQRSNYALRESGAGADRQQPHGPTAVTAHGANPGLVSHFVKQALLDIARDTGEAAACRAPSREDWAALAQRAGRQGDPHRRARHADGGAATKRKGEFVNTWSVDGFAGEGCQPAELGWGSHEKDIPGATAAGTSSAADCAIYLSAPAPRPGCAPGPRWKGRSTASWSPTTSRSRSPTTSRCGDGAELSPTGRRCTTPTTPATTRCCRCTSWRARTGSCRSASGVMMRRDHRRHGRARRAADGPRQGRLLVRLALSIAGGAARSRRTTTPPPCR